MDQNKQIKFISAALAIALLLEMPGFASELGQPLSLSPTLSNIRHASANDSATIDQLVWDPRSIEVSEKYLKVMETWRGRGNRLIIHIQDAHQNPVAQWAAAQGIEELADRYSLRLALSEGAIGDASLSTLKPLLPNANWRMEARRLVYEGALQAEEFVSLVGKRPIRIEGLEDRTAYDRNLRAYLALRRAAKQAEPYLSRWQSAVRKVKIKIYPRELNAYEHAQIDLQTDMARHLQQLVDLAANKNLPITEFAELSRFRIVQKLEKNISFERLNAEVAAAGPEALKQFADKKNTNLSAQLSLVNALCRSARTGAGRSIHAPELKKYRLYLDRFTRLDVSRMMDELSRLEENIYRAWLTSDRAKRLRILDKYLTALGKAFRIEMTNQDFAELEANAGTFRTPRWQAFLNSVLVEEGMEEEIIEHRGWLDAARLPARRFYRLAHARDRIFMQKAEAAFGDASAAFWISGGYHTKHLTRLFRSRGWSYVVLLPGNAQEANRVDYEARMKLQSRSGLSLSHDNLRPLLTRSNPASLKNGHKESSWAREILQQAIAKTNETNERRGARMAGESLGDGPRTPLLHRANVVKKTFREKMSIRFSRIPGWIRYFIWRFGELAGGQTLSWRREMYAEKLETKSGVKWRDLPLETRMVLVRNYSLEHRRWPLEPTFPTTTPELRRLLLDILPTMYAGTAPNAINSSSNSYISTNIKPMSESEMMKIIDVMLDGKTEEEYQRCIVATMSLRKLLSTNEIVLVLSKYISMYSDKSEALYWTPLILLANSVDLSIDQRFGFMVNSIHEKKAPLLGRDDDAATNEFMNNVGIDGKYKEKIARLLVDHDSSEGNKTFESTLGVIRSVNALSDELEKVHKDSMRDGSIAHKSINDILNRVLKEALNKLPKGARMAADSDNEGLPTPKIHRMKRATKTFKEKAAIQVGRTYSWVTYLEWNLTDDGFGKRAYGRVGYAKLLEQISGIKWRNLPIETRVVLMVNQHLKLWAMHDKGAEPTFPTTPKELRRLLMDILPIMYFGMTPKKARADRNEYIGRKGTITYDQMMKLIDLMFDGEKEEEYQECLKVVERLRINFNFNPGQIVLLLNKYLSVYSLESKEFSWSPLMQLVFATAGLAGSGNYNDFVNAIHESKAPLLGGEHDLATLKFFNNRHIVFRLKQAIAHRLIKPSGSKGGDNKPFESILGLISLINGLSNQLEQVYLVPGYKDSGAHESISSILGQTIEKALNMPSGGARMAKISDAEGAMTPTIHRAKRARKTFREKVAIQSGVVWRWIVAPVWHWQFLDVNVPIRAKRVYVEQLEPISGIKWRDLPGKTRMVLVWNYFVQDYWHKRKLEPTLPTTKMELRRLLMEILPAMYFRVPNENIRSSGMEYIGSQGQYSDEQMMKMLDLMFDGKKEEEYRECLKIVEKLKDDFSFNASEIVMLLNKYLSVYSDESEEFSWTPLFQLAIATAGKYGKGKYTDLIDAIHEAKAPLLGGEHDAATLKFLNNRHIRLKFKQAIAHRLMKSIGTKGGNSKPFESTLGLISLINGLSVELEQAYLVPGYEDSGVHESISSILDQTFEKALNMPSVGARLAQISGDEGSPTSKIHRMKWEEKTFREKAGIQLGRIYPWVTYIVGHWQQLFRSSTAQKRYAEMLEPKSGIKWRDLPIETRIVLERNFSLGFIFINSYKEIEPTLPARPKELRRLLMDILPAMYFGMLPNMIRSSDLEYIGSQGNLSADQMTKILDLMLDGEREEEYQKSLKAAEGLSQLGLSPSIIIVALNKYLSMYPSLESEEFSWTPLMLLAASNASLHIPGNYKKFIDAIDKAEGAVLSREDNADTFTFMNNGHIEPRLKQILAHQIQATQESKDSVALESALGIIRLFNGFSDELERQYSHEKYGESELVGPILNQALQRALNKPFEGARMAKESKEEPSPTPQRHRAKREEMTFKEKAAIQLGRALPWMAHLEWHLDGIVGRDGARFLSREGYDTGLEPDSGIKWRGLPLETRMVLRHNYSLSHWDGGIKPEPTFPSTHKELKRLLMDILPALYFMMLPEEIISSEEDYIGQQGSLSEEKMKKLIDLMFDGEMEEEYQECLKIVEKLKDAFSFSPSEIVMLLNKYLSVYPLESEEFSWAPLIQLAFATASQTGIGNYTDFIDAIHGAKAPLLGGEYDVATLIFFNNRHIRFRFRQAIAQRLKKSSGTKDGDSEPFESTLGLIRLINRLSEDLELAYLVPGYKDSEARDSIRSILEQTIEKELKMPSEGARMAEVVHHAKSEAGSAGRKSEVEGGGFWQRIRYMSWHLSPKNFLNARRARKAYAERLEPISEVKWQGLPMQTRIVIMQNSSFSGKEFDEFDPNFPRTRKELRWLLMDAVPTMYMGRSPSHISGLNREVRKRRDRAPRFGEDLAIGYSTYYGEEFRMDADAVGRLIDLLFDGRMEADYQRFMAMMKTELARYRGYKAFEILLLSAKYFSINPELSRSGYWESFKVWAQSYADKGLDDMFYLFMRDMHHVDVELGDKLPEEINTIVDYHLKYKNKLSGLQVNTGGQSFANIDELQSFRYLAEMASQYGSDIWPDLAEMANQMSGGGDYGWVLFLKRTMPQLRRKLGNNFEKVWPIIHELLTNAKHDHAAYILHAAMIRAGKSVDSQAWHDAWVLADHELDRLGATENVMINMFWLFNVLQEVSAGSARTSSHTNAEQLHLWQTVLGMAKHGANRSLIGTAAKQIQDAAEKGDEIALDIMPMAINDLAIAKQRWPTLVHEYNTPLPIFSNPEHLNENIYSKMSPEDQKFRWTIELYRRLYLGEFRANGRKIEGVPSFFLSAQKPDAKSLLSVLDEVLVGANNSKHPLVKYLESPEHEAHLDYLMKTLQGPMRSVDLAQWMQVLHLAANKGHENIAAAMRSLESYDRTISGMNDTFVSTIAEFSKVAWADIENSLFENFVKAIESELVSGARMADGDLSSRELHEIIQQTLRIELEKIKAKLNSDPNNIELQRGLAATERLITKNITLEFSTTHHLIPSPVIKAMEAEYGPEYWNRQNEIKEKILREERGRTQSRSEHETQILRAVMLLDLVNNAGQLVDHLSWEVYNKIMSGQLIDSPYASVVREHAIGFFDGYQRTEMKQEEQQAIIDLSIYLFREAGRILEESGASSENGITARELVRFNVDFSLFYLQSLNGDGTQQMGNVIKHFVLTAYNIFGRVIDSPESRHKFIQTIERALFERPEGKGILFKAASLKEFELKDGLATIENYINYSDYQTDGPPSREGSDFEAALKAGGRRAEQVSRPLLIRKSVGDAPLVEAVLQGSDEGDGRTVRIPASAFSKRKDLFGMYVPRQRLQPKKIKETLDGASRTAIVSALAAVLGFDASQDISDVLAEIDKGDKYVELLNEKETAESVASYLLDPLEFNKRMVWHDGVMVLLAKEAALPENRDRPFRIIIDNVEALPSRVRVQLNPVLWERRVEIPDQGFNLSLPPNLHFTFTADEEAEIEDDSFLNRVLIINTSGMTVSRSGYIAKTTEVSAETEAKLWEVRDKWLTQKWGSELTTMDLVQIALRAKGLSKATGRSESDVIAHEAAKYLWLRLDDRQERAEMEAVLQVLLGPFTAQSPTITRDGNKISFDGVVLEMADPLFARVANDNPDMSAEELFLAVYGYSITGIERRVLCELARDAEYGYRAAQIEGPSGEGKTEVARVFSRFFGLQVSERTINSESDLAEVRGRLEIIKGAKFILREAEYLDEVKDGGQAFIFNEINTNIENGLYQWLYPELAGWPVKYLPEFPPQDGSQDHVRKLAISRNNLWLFTVNPEGPDRNPMPASARSRIPRYHMTSDPSETEDLVKNLMRKQGFDSDQVSAYAPVLAKVHSELWRAKVVDNKFESPQDITRREIKRTLNRFKKGLSEDKAVPQAFAESVLGVYSYLWKVTEETEQARVIVSDILKNYSIAVPDGFEAQAAAVAAVREKGAALLLFDSGTESPAEEAIQILRAAEDSAESDQTIIRRLPLSFDHRRSQLIGGWVPNRADGEDGGRIVSEFTFGIGSIPRLIAEARVLAAQDALAGRPARSMSVILENYLRLDSKIAPLFNEFWQTGRIEVLDEMLTQDVVEKIWSETDAAALEALQNEFAQLRGKLAFDSSSPEERLEFAKWFYGKKPDNLKFVAVGFAAEPTLLGTAEIDRFTTVNLSKPWTDQRVEEVLKRELLVRNIKLSGQRFEMIKALTIETFNHYQNESPDQYDHLTFGSGDIRAFVHELLVEQNAGELIKEKDFEAIAKKTAYYTMGIGLQTAYRDELSYKPKPIDQPQDLVRYDWDAFKGRWIFSANGFSIETQFMDPNQKPDPSSFLAVTEKDLHQLASMIIAWRQGRTTIVEGLPGGGKTSGVEDLTKRLGLESYREPMFGETNVGMIFGRMVKKGGKFKVTAEPDAEGKFLLKYLTAYTSGGSFNADEGPVGENAREVISFLKLVADSEAFDLAQIHPELKFPTHEHPEGTSILTRHPDFRLFITMNPAADVEGREMCPYGVVTTSHKIWADNSLSMEDALRIIDFSLDQVEEGGQPIQYSRLVPDNIKRRLAQIHIEFLKKHPAKEELSPRQLIFVSNGIKRDYARQRAESPVRQPDAESALFAGVMAAFFERLSEEEREELGPILGNLVWKIPAWQKAFKVHDVNGGIDVGGLVLPKSSRPSNVDPRTIKYAEDLDSQNEKMRAIAYGLSIGMPVALFEAEGADALDLVRKFCLKTGRRLEILWSHPQMSRTHLVSSVLPIFEAEFDAHGVAAEKPGDEFKTALGFLLRHCLTEADYEKEKKSVTHPETVLFFQAMDMIPERQRVVLNEFLARLHKDRSFTVENPDGTPLKLILPEWVNLIASSGVEHHYSSAFINRFMPVRLEPLPDQELRTVIKNRYPLVDDDEFSWISSLSRRAAEWDREGIFGTQYAFTHLDVLKMAAMIQYEKNRDFLPLNENPFYYVLKAAQSVWFVGMQEDDLKAFEEEEILKGLLYNVIFAASIESGQITRRQIRSDYYASKRRIFDELGRSPELRRHAVDVSLEELKTKKRIMLPNGMTVEALDDGSFVIGTPAKAYPATRTLLADGLKLSGGTKDQPSEFWARINESEGNLRLEYDLVHSIGGIEIPRDEFNLAHALPIQEVATPAFMEHTIEHRILLASMLRSMMSYQDKTGMIHRPRAMSVGGDTGTGKTTLMSNLTAIWGMPQYTLNAYEDLKISDATGGLKLDKGRMELRLKELFMRIGTVRRIDPKTQLPVTDTAEEEAQFNKYYVPGRTMSTRFLTLFDEANASPELAHALAPWIRGEKRFAFECAGQTFEIEIEDEAFLALTYNPSERYSGREPLPRSVMAYADKFWPANPVRYSDETLARMLWEYHRRGIRSVHDAMNHSKQRSSGIYNEEKYHQVEARPFDLTPKSLRGSDAENEHRALKGFKRWNMVEWVRNIRIHNQLREEAAAAAGPVTAGGTTGTHTPAGKQAVEPFMLTYDLKDLDQRLQKARTPTTAGEWLDFSENILAPFLQAVSDGALTKEDEAGKRIRVAMWTLLETADRALYLAVFKVWEMYYKKSVDGDELFESMFAIRRLLATEERKVFLMSKIVSTNGKKAPYLFPQPQKIMRFFINFGEEHYRKIGIDPKGDIHKQPFPIAVELATSPTAGLAGYFEGEFAVVFRDQALAIGPANVSDDTKIGWVVWHEIGHMVDQFRSRISGDDARSFPHNLELNSMLFPLIFGKNPEAYLKEMLMPWIARNKDVEDVYVQAIKGILNGLEMRRYEMTHEWTLEDIKSDATKNSALEKRLITDKFEDDRVDQIVRDLLAMKGGAGSIIDLAAYVYHRPNRYLHTAGAGLKKITQANGKGGVEDLVRGADAGYKTETTGTVEREDVQVQNASEEERADYKPRTSNRPAGDGKGEPGDGASGEGQRGSEGGGPSGEEGAERENGNPGEDDAKTSSPTSSSSRNKMMKLRSIPSGMLRRFLAVFAGSPKTIRYPSDEGDEPDIIRLYVDREDPFWNERLVKALARVLIGVTVDISGSTTASIQVQDRESGKTRSTTVSDIFMEMVENYVALFSIASRRNKGVKYGFAAHGDYYEPFLDAKDSRNPQKVAQRLSDLKDLDLNPRNQGNNFNRVLRAIIDKHAKSDPQIPKLEIVITDGQVTVDRALLQEAHDKGIDIIIVGYGAASKNVTNFEKGILLPDGASSSEMLEAIIRIAMLKAKKGKRGMLPFQKNLNPQIGLAPSTIVGARLAETDGEKFYNENLRKYIKSEPDWFQIPLVTQNLISQSRLRAGLVQMAISSSTSSFWLFNEGIPATLNALGQELFLELWGGLVKMAISSGDDMGDLFFRGIPRTHNALPPKIFKKNWNDLVQTAISSGRNAHNVFEFGIPEAIDTGLNFESYQSYVPTLLLFIQVACLIRGGVSGTSPYYSLVRVLSNLDSETKNIRLPMGYLMSLAAADYDKGSIIDGGPGVSKTLNVYQTMSQDMQDTLNSLFDNPDINFANKARIAKALADHTQQMPGHPAHVNLIQALTVVMATYTLLRTSSVDIAGQAINPMLEGILNMFDEKANSPEGARMAEVDALEEPVDPVTIWAEQYGLLSLPLPLNVNKVFGNPNMTDEKEASDVYYMLPTDFVPFGRGHQDTGQSALVRQYVKHISTLKLGITRPARLIRNLQSYIPSGLEQDQKDLALQNLARSLRLFKSFGPFGVKFEDLAKYESDLVRLGLKDLFFSAETEDLSASQPNRLVDSEESALVADGAIVTLVKTASSDGILMPVDVLKDWCFSALLAQIDSSAEGAARDTRNLYQSFFGVNPDPEAPIDQILTFGVEGYRANPAAFDSLRVELRVLKSLESFLDDQALAISQLEVMA